MSTAGMRIGALPSLRLRNIEKIDSIYKITVYEGSNSQYYTFCTPECASFIGAYLEYRTRNGEKLEHTSFLIRDQFDITDLEQIRNRSKGISVNTIGVLLDTILLKAGLRTIDHTSKFNRKEVARAHGFRKFFTTQLINSRVNSEIREMLLGHKIGLASCYYRPTQEDMLKEYEKGIDLKPRIEDIEINLDELNKELRLKSDKQKLHMIRKYAGGVCTGCYSIPTKKISYDIGDAILVERYCDKCFNFSKDGRRKKDIDKLN
jgi:hypothetical protein